MEVQGIIDNSTGNLISAGRADFENCRSVDTNEIVKGYDDSTQTLMTNIPSPFYCFWSSGLYPLGQTTYHNWNGSEWIEIEI